MEAATRMKSEVGGFLTLRAVFRAAQQTDVSPGYSESLETIAEAFRELGPFDGRVLGSILSSFINRASI